MIENIDSLNVFAQGLVENLTPPARRNMARRIAKDLRASQAARIAAQRNPDGSAYEPRKPQHRRKKGRIKRAMFSKIRLNRYLKASASEHSATIAFTRSVEQIAKVHQFGLRDRVNRIRNLTVQYPQRQLLGFTAADMAHIEDIVINHLSTF